jgi:hypothetical protein
VWGFLIYPRVMYIFSLMLSIWYFVKSTNYKFPHHAIFSLSCYFLSLKVQLFLYLIMQLNTIEWTHMGEWRHSSTILRLGTRWRWVVSFAPRPLYPGHRTSDIHWIWGWVAPELAWTLCRKASYPCRESNPDSSAVQPIAQTLYRLSYPCSYFLSLTSKYSPQYPIQNIKTQCLRYGYDIASTPFLIISGQYNGHRDTIKFFINHISKYGNHQIPTIKMKRIITVVNSAHEQDLCI